MGGRAELTQDELDVLADILAARAHGAKVIRLKDWRGGLIAKTDVRGAEALRSSCADLTIGRKSLGTLLTSGNIGKLKRRAKEVAGIGQIHE